MVPSENAGIVVNAYPGDGTALLAFDLKESDTKDLAGFAVKCRAPKKSGGKTKQFPLKNRLNFDVAVPSAAGAQPTLTDSTEAPFQKFRWVHFMFEDAPGDYEFEVIPKYWGAGGELEGEDSCTLKIKLGPLRAGKYAVGFTRGYISSQAYVDRFHNAPITPPNYLKPGPWDAARLLYDTAGFEEQYVWLGHHGRKMLFEFLNECAQDPKVDLDAFAFDLDEPDIIRALEGFGAKLRILVDDSVNHDATSPEAQARTLLEASAGADHVKAGHYSGLSHQKVFIKKKNGSPVKVLAGSTNFQIRGLYVQANSVVVVDDPMTANLFEQAFEASWSTTRGFGGKPIAKKWHDLGTLGFEQARLCLSPHADAGLSLDPIADEIDRADRSVLFAVMSLASGGGPVMERLRVPPKDPKIFSYGITQRRGGVKISKTGRKEHPPVQWAYLKDDVPPPFHEEWSGGAGMAIHHKFVVIDFNDTDPLVYSGSSNLAKGGEEGNGDNLFAIEDRTLAYGYAIEAIRLIDHFHFRERQSQSKDSKPLKLWEPEDKGTPWYKSFYDSEDPDYHDRNLFVNPQ